MITLLSPKFPVLALVVAMSALVTSTSAQQTSAPVMTCGRASKAPSRTIGAEIQAAAWLVGRELLGAHRAAGRVSPSRSRTGQRFVEGPESQQAKRAPVASRKTCAERAPNAPLPECVQSRKAD